MTWLEGQARRIGLDVLVVILAAATAAEVAASGGASWLLAAAAGMLVVLLLARHRAPFGAPLAVWGAGAALSFADGRVVMGTFGIYVAAMAAAFLLGAQRDGARARLGLAAGLAAATVVGLNDLGPADADLVQVPASFAIAWLLGTALRRRASEAEAAEERARHAEREREAAARLAAAEERTRIARELHDVVAHAMSVMVLQVGAVRHRLPAALGEDAAALRGVEQTGRTALTEVRRLLGALRQEGEAPDLTPAPGLGRLDVLVAEIGRAGLPVRVRVDGEPVALPGSIDLSAYRIVQEGLTNVLRHAHASEAHVHVRYGADDLRIDVRDDGNGDGAGRSGGHGLAGVRERVSIYGGEMTAGPATGGGFVLSTRLPLREPGA